MIYPAGLKGNTFLHSLCRIPDEWAPVMRDLYKEWDTVVAYGLYDRVCVIIACHSAGFGSLLRDESCLVGSKAEIQKS